MVIYPDNLLRCYVWRVFRRARVRWFQRGGHMDQHWHEYCHRHTDNDSSVLFGSAAVQEETGDKRTHLTWTICKHIHHKHAYHDHLSTSSSLDGLRTQSLCYLDDPTRVVITKLILLLVHYYCHYYNYFYIIAIIFILFISSCIECLSLTEDLYSLSSLTFGYHVTRVWTPPPHLRAIHFMS